MELIYLTTSDRSAQITSAGISLGNLSHFQKHKLSSGDWLFIPGVDASFFDTIAFRTMHPFYDWVRQQYDYGANICSICTGTFFLAQSGVLRGKKATTHWKYFDRIQDAYPDIIILRDRLFVDEDRLLSSAGVASGIDLSLYILEQMYGPVFTTRIAKEVVIYLRRGPADPQLSIFLKYRNHIDQRVHDLQDILVGSLEERHTMASMAAFVNMSPRNLSRTFKKVTGITIGQYIEKLRVEKAVQMLAQGNTVESTALLVGLKSTNQLRTLIKRHQEKLPLSL